MSDFVLVLGKNVCPRALCPSTSDRHYFLISFSHFLALLAKELEEELRWFFLIWFGPFLDSCLANHDLHACNHQGYTGGDTDESSPRVIFRFINEDQGTNDCENHDHDLVCRYDFHLCILRNGFIQERELDCARGHDYNKKYSCRLVILLIDIAFLGNDLTKPFGKRIGYATL